MMDDRGGVGDDIYIIINSLYQARHLMIYICIWRRRSKNATLVLHVRNYITTCCSCCYRA